MLGYYADLPVMDLRQSTDLLGDYVVTNERSVDGYELAFTPGDKNDVAYSSKQHFAVWRKK